MFDIDFQFYPIFLTLAFISAYLLLHFFLRKLKISTSLELSLTINLVVALFFGMLFAMLFQNLYDFIQDPDHYKFSFGLTFYGGLIGGFISFMAGLLILRKKDKDIISKIAIVAPACITLAHGVGRIGCFFDGCCYGKETDSFLGIKFATTSTKVFPTNLFESIFLILLSVLLIFLAFKYLSKYCFVIYLFSYSIFRFLIEFLRGDDRGGFIPGLSPSQFWSIILFLIGIVYLIYLIVHKNKIIEKKENVDK